jgi:cyclopropane fatty-acyl-phospholipid synthase-like methyltransferase
MLSIKRLLSPTKKQSLGLDFRPGASHYRAYVGPPQDYDLISAMTFNLLTTLGLRQHHTLLDIGCGSLRIGRLLIPYLNVGNYNGIEPNEWLLTEAVQRETGQEQLRIKQPHFYIADSARTLPSGALYDFALAQSIFSHCGLDLMERWLQDAHSHLKDSGALLGTFMTGEQDNHERDWIYPHVVCYRPETMASLAERIGFKFTLLDWKHPRQQWALYAKPRFDTSWFQNRPLTWNTWLEFAPKLAT